ncbi:hypothetical protein DMA12_34765 [Amycolatopsis balhimycina DSM 5908]|uniref:Uncharacterized protein n=1 Tax=Amycolatopsis balhimycina DSM 5908 TaxID=1081091 RepID=A0A428W4A1_AMYBA|nr:hypothetical protein [Amycolatopsis balhimycina]RSM37922.1 hypothetical protein DMA12_34765 [Amycolatopsis balhimycina DSM 5908]
MRWDLRSGRFDHFDLPAVAGYRPFTVQPSSVSATTWATTPPTSPTSYALTSLRPVFWLEACSSRSRYSPGRHRASAVQGVGACLDDPAASNMRSHSWAEVRSGSRRPPDEQLDRTGLVRNCRSIGAATDRGTWIRTETVIAGAVVTGDCWAGRL